MLGRVAAWCEPACYQPSLPCRCALPVVVPQERGNPPGAMSSRVWWVLGHVRREFGQGWPQFGPLGNQIW